MSALIEQHTKWKGAKARLGDVPVKVKTKPVRYDAETIAEVIEAPIAVEAHFAFQMPPSIGLEPPWLTIAKQVAKKHGLTVNDLRSARRSKELVAARHEAFYRCKNETTMSYPAIGRRFGNRDHTTVIHGVRKHTERVVNSVENGVNNESSGGRMNLQLEERA